MSTGNRRFWSKIVGIGAIAAFAIVLVFPLVQSFHNGTGNPSASSELFLGMWCRRYATESAQEAQESEEQHVFPLPMNLLVYDDDTASIDYAGASVRGRISLSHIKGNRRYYRITPENNAGHWNATLCVTDGWQTSSEPSGEWYFSMTNDDEGWTFGDWFKFRPDGTATCGNGPFNPLAIDDATRAEHEYECVWRWAQKPYGGRIAIEYDGGQFVAFMTKRR